MDDGEVFEGRLRFGGDEEALWGNYFNAAKDGNSWATHVTRQQLERSVPVRIFGIEIADRSEDISLQRPFMARFGDIARIDGQRRQLRVTLKSGTEFELARFGADDFADGVRVWDAEGGVVDLDEWDISSIEFLPPSTATARNAAASLLHGTVHTTSGSFTGFVQWNRKQTLGSDHLLGRVDFVRARPGLRGVRADDALSLAFDGIRSIARTSEKSSLVLLADGREVQLSDPREGQGNSGMYVDDPRYGRVLVSWDAFERFDLTPGGHGPAYSDFPTGRPLTGTVVTRSGQRLTGRLVYDLDESETTETLDAPSQGIDYTILFGLVSSVEFPERRGERVRVTLHSGEQLQLERWGDLAGNTGMLIFLDGRERPEYVPWSDVAKIELDQPGEVYPGNGAR
jgi:hypothetical protein